MTYVLSVISRISSGNNEVMLKARGRAITSAVDIAQITKRRFLNTIEIANVTISSEEVEMKEGGGKRTVSAIEILLRSGEVPESKPSESSK